MSRVDWFIKKAESKYTSLVLIYFLVFFLQAVVINEVDSFLFRPHLELRAKYHAVSFHATHQYAHSIIVYIDLSVSILLYINIYIMAYYY